MAAESIIDFAGLESAAALATPAAGTEVSVETPEAGGGNEEVTVEGGAEGTNVPDVKVQGAEPEAGKEGVEGAEAAEGKTAEGQGSKTATTPQAVRQWLKKMRDAAPENISVAKHLNDVLGREQAYQEVFKTVQDARDVRDLVQVYGGREGLEALANFKNVVEASDELLFEGHPDVIANVVSDLKSAGKIDSLGKLATPFLKALQQEQPEVYKRAATTMALRTLEDSNFHKTFADMSSRANDLQNRIGQIVQGLRQFLVQGEGGKISWNPNSNQILDALQTRAETLLDYAKAVSNQSKGMADWYNEAKTENDEATSDKVTPEMEKLNQAREAFKKEQDDFASKKSEGFKMDVATDADKYNNRSLGKALGAYLVKPFFKAFPKETLNDLGIGIKQNLYEYLRNDKTYQAQMKAFWGQKTPNKDQILQYHNAKVDSIAEEIVRSVIQKRYPGYASGGAAAGRVAAAAAKKTADTKTVQQSVATGKPVYVAVKPKWDELDMARPDAQLLYIAGKGYTKSGKFVTWRK